MKKLVCVLFILFIPLSAGADYSIYLNNGSVISGVRSYDESEGEIIVYFGTGAMTLSQKDILKITGTETAGTEPREKEGTEMQQQEGTGRVPARPPQPQVQEPADNKGDRFRVLTDERNSVMSQIREAEAEETRLVTAINEKTGKRFSYNTVQLKQLEREVSPMQEELRGIQQKKAELLEKLSSVEAELNGME
jgi:hypothetical protein